MSLLSNLVARYALDETSGNAADSVGSATLTNFNTVTYVPSKINNGANLVAASLQRLFNTSIPLTTGTAPFAIALWVKTTTKFTTCATINKATPDNSRWLLDIACNNTTGFAQADLSFVGGTNTDVLITSAVDISDGNWHHMVVNCYNAASRANLELYVDGNFIGKNTHATDSYTLPSDFKYLNLGSGRNYTTPESFYRYWNGGVDEVYVWDNYTLTADDVSRLWNNGQGKLNSTVYQKIRTVNNMRPRVFAPGRAR